MSTFLEQAINYVSHLPQALKLTVILLVTIIEYVFPIFPSDTIVLVAGFFSVYDKLPVWALIVTTSIGSIVGTWLTFMIGRYLISKPKLSQSKLVRFQQWYARFGYSILLVSRFMPGIRSFFFVAAGFYRLSLPKVLLLGTISALMFNTMLLLLGRTIGKNTESITHMLQSYTIIFYGVFGLIMLIILLIFFRKKHKN